MINVMHRFSPKSFPTKCLKSPETPTKVLRMLARIINPSDYCLICDLELHPKNSENVVVYFNVRSCKGLTKVLGHDLRSSESQRICHQCKHKIDSSFLKKVQSAANILGELRKTYEQSGEKA